MMTMDRNLCETEVVPVDCHASQFDWEGRVMAVAAVWVSPGVVAGALARLCIPEGGPASWWLLGGGILAAIAGGLLEADHWPW